MSKRMDIEADVFERISQAARLEAMLVADLPGASEIEADRWRMFADFLSSESSRMRSISHKGGES